jgi:DNA-binding MarR family transcriptional regulator
MMSRHRRYDSPTQEAYLALWRCYDRLRAIEEELFAEYGISAQQYNVLRLLKASHPLAVPTTVLVAQLVSRAPDMTRMLDKLAERGWIERERSTTDRRTMLVNITPVGQDLLKKLRDPVRQVNEAQLGHLSATDLRQLTVLLKKAGTPHEPPGSPWLEPTDPKES